MEQRGAAPFIFLPHRFDDAIICHADFVPACQLGYECYEWYEDFVDCVSTWQGIEASLVNDMCRRYDSRERIWGVPSLPGRVGFCLGWLSALACIDRRLALQGLDLLSDMISYQYQEEVGSGLEPLMALPGLLSAAWREGRR